MTPLFRTLLWAASFLALQEASDPVAAQGLVDPPENQAARAGDNATFSVEPRHGGLAYQWLRQWPDKTEVLNGQTGNRLTLTNVAVGDVGLYLCAVAQESQIHFTSPATLTVWTPTESAPFRPMAEGGQRLSLLDGGDSFTVYAPPVTSGGSSGTCPGSYAGYVSYRKSVGQGWGWVPSTGTSVHTATDTTRSDTKVTYTGYYYDSGCQQTPVTVPDPTYSPKYRFDIYFPSDVPSTNAYPLTLTGFDP